MSETKTCTCCKRKLPYTEFHKHGERKDGLNNICKSCKSKYAKEYYQKNKEKIKKKTMEYHWKNREKRLQWSKEHYIKNKEEYRRKHKKYYQENKEKALEYGRDWIFALRLKALTKLRNAPECVYCFNNDLRVLVIDHVNDDGAIERKILTRSQIYKKIIDLSIEEAKKEYQVLCRNCNWIKNLETKGSVLYKYDRCQV